MGNIILLHGALGSSEDLNALSKVLIRSGLTVSSFSFSGHGKTSFGSTFGIEQFALELENHILENNLKNSSVFGYSMGGFVALYLASKQKNIIKNIVTLGTKFNWSKDAVEKEIKMLNPELMLAKVPSFAKTLEIKHGSEWKTLVLNTANMMKELEKKNLLDSQIIKSIETRVFMGLGDNDQMVSLEETAVVFQHLQNKAMFMLPICKHQIESAPLDLLGKIIYDYTQKENQV